MTLKRILIQGVVIAAIMMIGGVATATGQTCQTIDFDNLSPGTPVNNQYLAKGVTFSLTGGINCIGALPTISNSNYPRSSPQVLRASGTDGCCITITFTDLQNEVGLHVSQECAIPPCDQITVTPYHDVSGSIIAGTPVTVTPTCGLLSGGGSINTWQLVKVISLNWPACDIVNIDVCVTECSGQKPEVFEIDDLFFGSDATKPIVRIDTPLVDAVACDGAMVVFGESCDADACSYNDVLRIRTNPTGGTPGPWSTIGTAAVNRGCFPTPAVLYSVPPLPLSYLEENYTIEVEGTNACGLQAHDTRDICLDRKPPSATISCPTSGKIITSRPPHGPLQISGSVSDFCGVKSWNLERTIFFLGTWTPLSPTHSGSGGPLLGTWNTTTTPDGGYKIRVRAQDFCGRTNSQTVKITVDNTYPVAVITQPAPCTWVCTDFAIPIYGIAYDKNIKRWSLDYSIGGSNIWNNIATGNGNVGSPNNPQILWPTWNTCGLAHPLCCYTLRLTVEDKAESCKLPTTGNISVAQQCGELGKYSDCNRNGVVGPLLDPSDQTCFNQDYNSPACPCP